MTSLPLSLDVPSSQLFYDLEHRPPAAKCNGCLPPASLCAYQLLEEPFWLYASGRACDLRAQPAGEPQGQRPPRRPVERVAAIEELPDRRHLVGGHRAHVP